ncbi:hypothetical protein A2U01_0011064, partial [Trifolium medium]|nr:hypothetical protein [Trifolium medium]
PSDPFNRDLWIEATAEMGKCFASAHAVFQSSPSSSTAFFNKMLLSRVPVLVWICGDLIPSISLGFSFRFSLGYSFAVVLADDNPRPFTLFGGLKWTRIRHDRNRPLPLPGQITHGSRMSREILFPCTRNVGTIFPRICSRALAHRRIERSASLACRGGFAPRGAGELFKCTR